MFPLAWVISNAKKIFFYISGAALLATLWRLFQEFLKARAVKRSDVQGHKDELVLSDKVQNIQEQWEKDASKTDKLR